MTAPRKRIGLAIPKVLYEKIYDIAQYQGLTMNSFIIQLLWDWVETNKAS